MNNSIRRSPRLSEPMQGDEDIQSEISTSSHEREASEVEYSLSDTVSRMDVSRFDDYASTALTESVTPAPTEVKLRVTRTKAALNKVKSKSLCKKKGIKTKPKKAAIVSTQWNPIEIKESYNSIKNSIGTWDTNWDKLKKEVGCATNVDAGLGSRLPTTTRNVYLVRHGQYRKDTDDDGEDTLTELGLTQSAETGARMAAMGIQFDRLVHSTMSRARETADQICQHIMAGKQTERCDLLREGCPIEPVPKLRGYKPASCVIHKDEYRIEAAFRKYMYRADVTQKYTTNDVLVCHGNVIRYFVCRSLQLPTEGWLRLNINNASITQLSIDGEGKITLRYYADAGHLAPEQLTTD